MSRSETDREKRETAAARQDRLQAAAQEYMQAALDGKPVGIGEFVSRYPDIADDLRNLLENSTSLDLIPIPTPAADDLPRTRSGAPLRLRVLDGPLSGRDFAFDRAGVFLLGRASRGQVAIPSGPAGDLRVSHAHCLIELNPPLCRVHDLSSRNGTFVNDTRIATCFLSDGDLLRIGRSAMRVDLPETPAHLSDADDVDEPEIPLPTPTPAASPAARANCPVCLQTKTLEEPFCSNCRDRAELLPQPIPGYRLIREIGRGDLGAAFLAFNERDLRALALKKIDLPDSTSSDAIERFRGNSDYLQRLRHRHVISCNDIGLAGKSIYVAGELIRGTDAVRLVRKHGPLQVHVAVRIVCQVLSALNYFHRLGIAHGDLKPANVLIKVRPDSRTVKVADGGLARLLWKTVWQGVVLPCDTGCTTAYLAPEVVLHFREATAMADQYAAAAVLYFLLTNGDVYEQPKTLHAQLAQILDEDITPIRDRRPNLPPKLISIIHRALSREPQRRFADVQEMKKALLPFGEG